MSLTQTLRRAVQVSPAKIAVTDQSESKTWFETASRVARIASWLKQRGFGDGDRVAVLSLNNFRYFELLYSVPWAGGSVVPINTRLAAPEIDYILKDSGSKFLFIDQTFQPLVASLGSAKSLAGVVVFDGERSGGIHSYEEVLRTSEEAIDANKGGQDLAGIYYTGGTTGYPKGVMLTHDNLVANALNVIVTLQYDRDTHYLHAAPMFHLADGCSSFGVTMQAGSHVFIPRFEAELFLRTIENNKITNVTLVPTMINMFLNHPKFREFDLSSMKRIFFGAAPMSDGLLRRALSEMPNTKFQQAWGMTELSPIATTMDARFSVLDGPYSGKLRSCGQAVSLVDIRVVDGDGKEVPRGTVGEVAVRGPTVMKGYWNQPEATRTALRDGWMHSGDGGYMDDDGFLYIVDRMKDMIVTGAENVYSAEVESTISLMDGVSEVAVIGIPSDEWGETVHAVVVMREGFSSSEKEIVEFCRGKIASYKCPRSVEFRATSLPLSAAGKVLKTELRAPFWKGRERAVN